MNKKTRILVIYTGGTIGSVRYVTKEKEVIKGQPKDILKLYPEASEYFKSSTAVTLLCDNFFEKYPFYKNDVIFDNHLDLEILSENMSIDIWNKLIQCLKNYNFSNYDGVIITHGTDTLGYTANLLAMLYSNIQIPMFLVSSNDSLDSELANGIYNFKGAIDFIKNEGVPGVYVTYADKDKIKVFYGSRILQCKQLVDDFDAINTNGYSPLGTMSLNGKFMPNNFELLRSIKFNKRENPLIMIDNLKINANILKVSPYVGLNYDNFNIFNCNAVMHTCYHSGTSCTIGKGENSILEFIRMCSAMGVDFFYGPIYGDEDKAIYETTHAVMKAGANVIKNVSEENALVKLLLAYSEYDNINNIINYVDTDINNEHIYVKKR